MNAFFENLHRTGQTDRAATGLRIDVSSGQICDASSRDACPGIRHEPALSYDPSSRASAVQLSFEFARRRTKNRLVSLRSRESTGAVACRGVRPLSSGGGS